MGIGVRQCLGTGGGGGTGVFGHRGQALALSARARCGSKPGFVQPIPRPPPNRQLHCLTRCLQSVLGPTGLPLGALQAARGKLAGIPRPFAAMGLGRKFIVCLEGKTKKTKPQTKKKPKPKKPGCFAKFSTSHPQKIPAVGLSGDRRTAWSQMPHCFPARRGLGSLRGGVRDELALSVPARRK